MQIAVDLIGHHSKGSARSRLMFLIRLKFDNERGFVKDHRIKTLSQKYSIASSSVSRHLTRLKREGLVSVCSNGFLSLSNLNSGYNGRRSKMSTVKIHAKMSDAQILKQLYSKVARKKLKNMEFLVNVKSDHEKLRDLDIYPKHFNSEKALIRAEKKYVLKPGISREVNRELTISDSKFAKLFGVSRRFYNQTIKPSISKRCGITIEVRIKEVPNFNPEQARYQNIKPLFVDRGRVFSMRTYYKVREKEITRKGNFYKGDTRKGKVSKIPL